MGYQIIIKKSKYWIKSQNLLFVYSFTFPRVFPNLFLVIFLYPYSKMA